MPRDLSDKFEYLNCCSIDIALMSIRATCPHLPPLLMRLIPANVRIILSCQISTVTNAYLTLEMFGWSLFLIHGDEEVLILLRFRSGRCYLSETVP